MQKLKLLSNFATSLTLALLLFSQMAYGSNPVNEGEEPVLKSAVAPMVVQDPVVVDVKPLTVGPLLDEKIKTSEELVIEKPKKASWLKPWTWGGSSNTSVESSQPESEQVDETDQTSSKIVGADGDLKSTDDEEVMGAEDLKPTDEEEVEEVLQKEAEQKEAVQEYLSKTILAVRYLEDKAKTKMEKEGQTAEEIARNAELVHQVEALKKTIQKMEEK